MPFVQRQHRLVSALFEHLVSQFLVQLRMRNQRVKRHMIDASRYDGLAIWRNLAVLNDGDIALHAPAGFGVQVSHDLSNKNQYSKRIKARNYCVSSGPSRLNLTWFKTANKYNGFQNLLFLMFPAARSVGGAA
jgi:hypothetical protein